MAFISSKSQENPTNIEIKLNSEISVFLYYIKQGFPCRRHISDTVELSLAQSTKSALAFELRNMRAFEDRFFEHT